MDPYGSSTNCFGKSTFSWVCLRWLFVFPMRNPPFGFGESIFQGIFSSEPRSNSKFPLGDLQISPIQDISGMYPTTTQLSIAQRLRPRPFWPWRMLMRSRNFFHVAVAPWRVTYFPWRQVIQWLPATLARCFFFCNTWPPTVSWFKVHQDSLILVYFLAINFILREQFTQSQTCIDKIRTKTPYQKSVPVPKHRTKKPYPYQNTVPYRTKKPLLILSFSLANLVRLFGTVCWYRYGFLVRCFGTGTVFWYDVLVRVRFFGTVFWYGYGFLVRCFGTGTDFWYCVLVRVYFFWYEVLVTYFFVFFGMLFLCGALSGPQEIIVWTLQTSRKTAAIARSLLWTLNPKP